MIKKIRKVCERTWDWQCSCDTQDILNTGTSQEIWGLVSDHWASLVAQMVKKSTYSAGDPDLILELRRSPGEGNGYPQ